LSLAAIEEGYRSGALTPELLLQTVYARIDEAAGNPVWIALRDRGEVLAEARALPAHVDAADLPLYGVPFAVKDNIDAAGLPTTAGCPRFAYSPRRSAAVVDRLRAAGALLIGKTNLDQFATGLVGTRSPYGPVRNAFDPAFVSGGSSSGSAVAVALGQVCFALGTDTAGSGRVPAGFNGIVGCKPTRGLFSTSGVVPACRSLDCVSLFTGNVADAARIFSLLDAYDADDPYARVQRQPQPLRAGPLRIGVPAGRNLDFFGDAEYERLFAAAAARMRALGHAVIEVDIDAFLQAGALLYEGAWVAERYAAVGEFIAQHPADADPAVRDIILRGGHFSAADAFRGLYRLEELRRQTAATWHAIDVLLVPTAGTIHRIADVASSPIVLNAQLGRYTNFVNLLDLCGLAVPAGHRSDGLPFGVTLLAPALHDRILLDLGARWTSDRSAAPPDTPQDRPRASAERAAGDAGAMVRLAVVGAHLSGQPLNGQLTSRGARLVRTCRTAPLYRLFALPGTRPPKPGLVRGDHGTAIEVEVWELSAASFGRFVAAVPPPLAIGTLQLEDGDAVPGFLCEEYAVREAPDISAFGGWRAYLRDGGAAADPPQ